MAIIIRQSVPADVFAIRKVQRLTWLSTYPNVAANITSQDIEAKFQSDDEPSGKQKIEQHKKSYADASKQIWVAESNHQIIGFCVAGKENDRNRILAIYVLPEYQGQGIGSKLFQEALHWLGDQSSIFINVVSYNNNAIDFYKSHGFIETGKKGVFDQAAQLPSGKFLPEIELVKNAS